MGDDRERVALAAAVDALGGGAWRPERLHGSGGGRLASTVWRLRSPTRTVVVKLVHRNDAGPSEPSSWTRELEVHRSAWLADVLPDGVRLPAVHATRTTHAAAVLVLEDVAFDAPRDRGVAWSGRLARRFAALAAAPLDTVPRWASRGFVHEQLDEVVAGVERMRTEPPSTHVAALVEAWREPLVRLVAALPAVRAWVDAQPVALAHLDLFSRNVADLGDELVVIDWAYAGVAPVGADAAGIVAMTAMHADVAADQVEALREAVVDGYVDGVRTARPDRVGADVARAVDRLLVLRWAAFLAQVQLAGDDIAGIAGDIAGLPFDRVRTAWTALAGMVAGLAEPWLDELGAT